MYSSVTAPTIRPTGIKQVQNCSKNTNRICLIRVGILFVTLNDLVGTRVRIYELGRECQVNHTLKVRQGCWNLVIAGIQNPEKKALSSCWHFFSWHDNQTMVKSTTNTFQQQEEPPFTQLNSSKQWRRREKRRRVVFISRERRGWMRKMAVASGH